MKHIQLKYKGTGRRTVNIRTYGFMGPAKSPMGKGPLNVAGEYLRAGTLTTSFQLEIPPSGECQVVDCQHNREMLRKVTKTNTKWEEIKKFDEESGKYFKDRKLIEIPAGFEVIDGTDIEKDIAVDPNISESDEVKELKDKIAKLEGGKKGEAKSKVKTSKTKVASGKPAVEPFLPVEEDEPIKLSKEQIKKNRFSKKVELV